MVFEPVLPKAIIGVDPEAILRGELGWDGIASPPVRLCGGGDRFRLRPFAARDGWTALLHEVQPTESIPSYAVRLHLARRIQKRGSSALIVHSHRLQPLQVWQWIDCGRWPGGQYREQSVFGDDGEALRERLRALGPAQRNSVEPPAVERRLAAAIATALERRLRGRNAAIPGARPARAHAAVRWLERFRLAIEETEDPRVLRSRWRCLREVALLDPACGRGDRLLAALLVLEVLNDACLERMQAWVDELRRSRERQRPEKLADFRRILARATDARRHPHHRHFIVESILRTNLYGAEPRARSLRECEQRLRAELGSYPGGDFALNLREGDASLGYSTETEVREALGSNPVMAGRAGQILEEAESLFRAERMLEEMEESQDGDPVPEPFSYQEIEARRNSLRLELDAMKAAECGIPWDDIAAVRQWAAIQRPVHLWAEFLGIAWRGGFDRSLDGEPERPPHVRETSPIFGAVPGAAVQKPRVPPTMSDETIRIDAGAATYPRRLSGFLGSQAHPSLFLRGNAELLNRPLLSIFCSNRVPGSIILRSLDAAREIRGRGAATISGFHSPLERECLSFLLRGPQPVVISPARGIEPMRLPRAWQEALGQGRLLLVTGFEGRQRRPTTRMAEARNLLVAALAVHSLIAHAAPGSRTYRLARLLLDWRRPVFTWDDPQNAALVRLGVRPVASLEECLP